MLSLVPRLAHACPALLNKFTYLALLQVFAYNYVKVKNTFY